MAQQDRQRVRIVGRADGEGHCDVAEMTPAERLAMMWQLTRDAWAFKDGGQHAESRLQRHVVRLRRRER